MASMNWLGFSLSPQEFSSQAGEHHSAQSSVSRLGFDSDEISGHVTGDCFDHSSTPSLILPPPFGLLESYNHRPSQSQDWNFKNTAMNSDNYKDNSSELSILMATPSCSSRNIETHHQPKLENFLGRETQNSYAYAANVTIGDGCDGGANAAIGDGCDGGANGSCVNNSSIGLSMIKTWLRSQPTHSIAENKNDDGRSRTRNAQSLSLSMSTGSSSPLPLLQTSSVANGGGESSSSENQQNKTSSGMDSKNGAIEGLPRKSIDTFGQRTSIYRGVTRHRWTGRYEAHLWDNSCRREGQTRKGRQVYLGGYDKEDKAARAYDLAALKYWGTTTTTNFPISNYEKEIEEMKHMTRQEYVASLRRKSSGFSRGASIYRGVTRHHQHGRWQARIGRVAGNKDLYLGTFSTQEEAAEAYDIAAIKFRGLNAVTNFDMNRYDVKSILESSTLPIGGASKRLKDVDQAEIMSVDGLRTDEESISQLTDHGMGGYGGLNHHPWLGFSYQQAQFHPYNGFHHPYGQRGWCKQEQDSEVVSHGFHDLQQLQTGNTHNFFQNNSSLHNLTAMDSSSMEHSSGSNSILYSNGGGGDGGNNNSNGGVIGYGSCNNGGGYGIPVGTAIISNDHENGGGGYENLFGNSVDPYQGRNLYCLSQQSPVSTAVIKPSAYDQGSACNNWVPTAVPALAPRSTNMAVCHGTPAFTIWNDS